MITGATSMIGTALIDVAIREGVEVYAIVRPDSNRLHRIAKSTLVHVIKAELEALEEINEISKDVDTFYHFAWKGTNKTLRNNPVLQEENIGITLKAVKLAEKIGCTRFVGVGSQAEYGPSYEIIDGDTACKPTTAYGAAKLAAGILSGRLCLEKGMEHIWGRVFSVYGPHDNAGTMLRYAIEAWERQEVAKFTAATQMWNYLYESDAGELFYQLGKAETEPGMYLVANPESKRLRDYIELMMRIYGSEAKSEFAKVEEERVPGLQADMSQITKKLNWKPQVSFETGIAKMINYIREEGNE